MARADEREPAEVGLQRTLASPRTSWSRARWVTHGAAVLLTAALAGTACSSSGGPSPAMSSSTSGPTPELPAGGTAKPPATPKRPGESGHVSKGPARVVVNNGKIAVCSLIPGGQVDQIMQASLPRPKPVIVGTFDECMTTLSQRHSSHAAPIRIAWAVPPELDPTLVFRQMTASLPQRVAVQGLGDMAYCSAETSPASSRLFIIRGRTLLEVFADTCGHATALAKIAISRL